ncbi:MAG: hypothetical protein AMXMBFR77_00610 [Phycisphaerales bacterium]|nr:hypothetical protein [cyanobacterium CYA1]MDL1903761.1 hypothetical protein [Synechococcales cyanobacterium CNB]GIK18485.1 MAG: hypothetical protein BroJett004_06490 [Planctomycetota bacterium]
MAKRTANNEQRTADPAARKFALRCSFLIPLLSLPAAADPPFILIDRDLRERRVELAAITDRAVSFVDEIGLARTEPLDRQLALLRITSRARFDAATVPGWYERFLRLEVQPDEPQIDESAPGMLVLTDGQRLPGRLAEAPAADGRVRWEHALFGTLDVDLERVRAVALASPWTARPPPIDDTITLTNGDRVQGFVERIGPEIVLDSGGSHAVIPIARAGMVELANPPASLDGPAVWLADGSVLALSSITVSITGRAELASDDVSGSAGPVASISASQIAAIAFDAGSLVPLASIPPVESHAGAARVPPPSVERIADAPLGAGDLVFPGPIDTQWPLPRGSSRLAATVELPPASWVWGDCEVVVSVTAPGIPEREITRIRVNGERPIARLDALLPSPARTDRTLRITIDPGEFGPIQDRPVLRRALLLIDRVAADR